MHGRGLLLAPTALLALPATAQAEERPGYVTGGEEQVVVGSSDPDVSRSTTRGS